MSDELLSTTKTSNLKSHKNAFSFWGRINGTEVIEQKLKSGVADFGDSLLKDFLQKPSIRYAYFFGSKGKILWDLQNNNVDISASDLKKTLKIECWDSNKMYIEMIKDFVFNFIDHQSSKICKVSEALSVLEYIEQAKQFKDIDTNE